MMESESHIRAAKQIGGARLVKIVEMLFEKGYDFPLNAGAAIKIQGVGKTAISNLQKIGLVEQDFPNGLSGLSTRAVCRLWMVDAKSKEAAIEAITSRKLDPCRSPRGYGWKTHIEVCKWAGLPKPVKPVKQIICCHCGKNALA